MDEVKWKLIEDVKSGLDSYGQHAHISCVASVLYIFCIHR